MVAECDKASHWLAEKSQAQASLRQTDDPLLTAEDIRKRESTVLRFCEPLLSKPPPPPKARPCLSASCASLYHVLESNAQLSVCHCALPVCLHATSCGGGDVYKEQHFLCSAPD